MIGFAADAPVNPAFEDVPKKLQTTHHKVFAILSNYLYICQNLKIILEPMNVKFKAKRRNRWQ